MKKNTNKILIALWFTLFVISEILLLFNMTINVDSSNWYIYIIDFLLIGLVFLPVPIISMKFKITGKRLILGYILEAFFALVIFVSIGESTIDKDGTIRQVNNFLDFVTGKEKTNEAPEAFTIEIIDIKDEYKINDVINYKVKVDNKESNTAIACEVKNDLVKVDTVNKTIECLANGDEKILFYSAIDNNICYTVSLKINSKVITSIKLNEEKKDIFLDINQTYQLNKPTITPSDAEIIDYTYTSSNTKVAIVNENGLIEAIGYGNAVIKCKSGKVSDSVYVCVGANIKFDISEESVSIYPEYDLYETLHIYVDNVLSIDKSRIKYSYESEFELEIFTGSNNSIENFFNLGIYHKNKTITKKEVIELEISYNYKGGFIISDTIIVEILPYDDILLEHIDLDSTNINSNADIFYTENNLITKFYNVPIIYNRRERINIYNFKYESETLDVSNSLYDMMIVNLAKSDLSILEHTVKLYPSKNIDDYIEFNISLNKVNVSDLSSTLDFELRNLYSKDENKKNEIYYKYFDKMLFEGVEFNEKYFNNTGILIELSEDCKEYVKLEVDEFGFIKSLELLNYKFKEMAAECELTFYVSSQYDPSVKKEYVINVVNQYDDVLASIDGENYSNELDVKIYEKESFKLSFKYIMNLEYKGDFQTELDSLTNRLSFSSEDINVIEWNGNNVVGLKKGAATLTISLLSSIYEDPCTITINIIVDGPDDSISAITLHKELIDSLDSCKPNFDKGYCSVGTSFKIYVDDTDNFIFKSSDESIAIIENGVVKALKAGSVSIIVQYKNDVSISSVYTLKVYDIVLPFDVLQGDFSKITYSNNKYTVHARIGQQYQIKLNIPDLTTSKYFKYTTKNEGIELSQTGSVTVNAQGSYTITIQNGESDSPYKEKVTLIIKATNTGFSSQFVYFIRKLAGHFAVFMLMAIFGLVATNITLECENKKRNKLFVLLACLSQGFLVSVSTELIQKVTPGRYFHWGDVWINMSGYLTGISLVILVNFIIVGIKKIRNKSS